MAREYRYLLDERSLSQQWLLPNVWMPIARRLPTRLKPNVLTIAGGVAMLIALAAVYAGRGGNRWGYLGAALCTGFYLTVDNVDGPHARSTRQCSRLGELLDHGLDAVSGAILCFATALCLGLSGAALFAYVGAVAITYFATLWDQRETGVLHSDRWGANEAILVCLALFLLLFAWPDASWIAFRPGAGSLAALMVAATLVGSMWTLTRIVIRLGRRAIGLTPMVLCTALLGALAGAGRLDEHWAAAGVLAINVALSGSLLLERMTGHRRRCRPLRR